MLQHLLTQRATILSETSAVEDRYSNPVKIWADATDGRTFACRIDPTASQESEIDRNTRKSWFRIFLTPEAQGFINAKSRIVVEDLTYEVFGDVEVYRKRANTDHIEAVLRRIEE